MDWIVPLTVSGSAASGCRGIVRSPRQMLVREPDRTGIEGTDEHLALGAGLVQFAEPDGRVATDHGVDARLERKYCQALLIRDTG